MKVLRALPIAIALAAPCAASADVRQLMVATYYAWGAWSDNRVFRIPLEGPRAYTLIEFAGPEDGLDIPAALTVDPASKRLYVGNIGTHEIIEFEINADGSKGAARVFGQFYYDSGGVRYTPDFFSMAVRPSTGRIYIGSVADSPIERRGIFIMNEGGNGAVQVVSERPAPQPAYFYDECWILFDPEDDSVLWVGTGFDNHLRKFNADTGAELGYLHAYDEIAYQWGSEDPGYYLPHYYFAPEAGGGHSLIVASYLWPMSWRKLLRFNPYTDTFLGFVPSGNPLQVPITTFDFERDRVSGKVYGGGFYGMFYEIAADYSGYETFSERFGYPQVTSAISHVALSYGHSTGADFDGDGFTDDVETGVFGTDPYEADSDGDGLTDYEEVAYGGDPAAYTPGVDTDPLSADSDGDGFSDLVEIAGGSDPLEEGWTAGAVTIRVSFGPAGSSRTAGYAVDTGAPYDVFRNHGWR